MPMHLTMRLDGAAIQQAELMNLTTLYYTFCAGPKRIVSCGHDKCHFEANGCIRAQVQCEAPAPAYQKDICKTGNVGGHSGFLV